MDVVVVEHVRARGQHRGEALAGAQEDLAQEALLGLRPAPAALDRDDVAVGELDRHHVDGVAEAVLGELGAGLVVAPPAGIGAGVDLGHRHAEIQVRGGLDRVGEQASASASAGQPSVIRCFITTVPPASRVTRKGCCMPQGPGPSIAAIGVMNSVGSTSFFARQTCSAWSRHGSRRSNRLIEQAVSPAPNSARAENRDTPRHMTQTMRTVA